MVPEADQQALQQSEIFQGQPTPEPPKSSAKLIAIIILVVILLGAIVIATQKGQKQEVAEAPQEEVAPSLTLSLLSPSEGDIAVDGEIVVRGNTLPNTTVVIFTQSDETSVESDEIGNFEETILLVDGENTLTVTAFSDDGQEKSISVSVNKES